MDEKPQYTQIDPLPMPATETPRFMQPLLDIETFVERFRGVIEQNNPSYQGLKHIFQLQGTYDPVIEKKAVRNKAAKFYNSAMKNQSQPLSPKQKEALTYIRDAIAVTDNEISLEESSKSIQH